ncbi:MAG TPA: cytochrome c oxidase subunit II [Candidatus Nitrosotalea sp.]|nr:cytochrome c oxidase subunit II [Candidatus Nitrosotalea sp.]
MGSRRRGARRLFSATLLALGALVLLALPALASGTPSSGGSGLDPLVPYGYSTNGRDIYNLYTYVISPFAIVVFLLVEGLILAVIIKFRASKQPPGYQPPQWHGNVRLEVIWTVIPFLILIVIGGSSAYVLQKDFVEPPAASGDVNLTITGHQFGWNFSYDDYGFQYQSNSPDGIRSISPIVIPVNRLVRIRLQSVDVIHGFWVPDLTGKTDLVPGYTNYTWLNVTQTGEWRGQCTELCGVGHYSMVLLVKAVSQSDFQAWVAQQKAAAHKPSPSPSASASPSPSPSAASSPRPSPSSSPSPVASPGASPLPSPA